MKKYLLILFLSLIYFNYSGAQNIINTITSVYIDGKKIEKSSEELLVNSKKNRNGYTFLIQYKEVKTKIFISHSEIVSRDSISVAINSFAKKNDVDIIDAIKFGNMFVTRCINCKENIPYRSIITLYKSDSLP